MNIRRRDVEELTIEEYVVRDDAIVLRMSDHHYVVCKDQMVRTFYNSRWNTARAVEEVWAYISDTDPVLPCVRCGRPREVSSYCADCERELRMRSRDRRKQSA